MVEGGMTCVKYLLFVFNFLFFVIGLGLVICGAVIQGSFREYFDIIGSQFNSAAALLIAVGCIIFIIGFFGCCGAVRESYCMVQTFAVLLAIVFVLEIAAGIVAFKMQSHVVDIVKKGLNESMDKYENATASRQAWDAVQKNLHCCGVDNGPEDWTDKVGDDLEYPKSCCKHEDEDKDACGEDVKLAYTMPCVRAMGYFVEKNVHWIGVIGVCMAIVQIVGIIFACCLARTIKHEYQPI